MARSNLQSLNEGVLFLSAVTTFGSGLVQLFCFHVGQGTLRDHAFGVGRLLWLNLHRLPAFVVVVSLLLHVALSWKVLLARLGRLDYRRHGAKNVFETILYATFCTSAVTGLVCLLIPGGAAPFHGPVPLGPLPHFRHRVVDIHHVTGLLALVLSANHVVRRWPSLVRGLRSLLRAFSLGNSL